MGVEALSYRKSLGTKVVVVVVVVVVAVAEGRLDFDLEIFLVRMPWYRPNEGSQSFPSSYSSSTFSKSAVFISENIIEYLKPYK